MTKRLGRGAIDQPLPPDADVKTRANDIEGLFAKKISDIRAKLDQCATPTNRQCAPQGSCLGPLLFKIYRSRLFDVISHHLSDIHSYAEDSQLYVGFRPHLCINCHEKLHYDIRQWILLNKLIKFNDDKIFY